MAVLEQSTEVTVHVCKRGDSRKAQKRCVECDKPATLSCSFALRGIKVGQFCDRSLCHNHAEKVDGKAQCQTHARLTATERGV